MKSFFSTLLATAFGGALWAVMVKVIAALILVAVIVIMFWGREIGLVEGQHARYPWQYSKVLIVYLITGDDAVTATDWYPIHLTADEFDELSGLDHDPANPERKGSSLAVHGSHFEEEINSVVIQNPNTGGATVFVEPGAVDPNSRTEVDIYGGPRDVTGSGSVIDFEQQGLPLATANQISYQPPTDQIVEEISVGLDLLLTEQIGADPGDYTETNIDLSSGEGTRLNLSIESETINCECAVYAGNGPSIEEAVKVNLRQHITVDVPSNYEPPELILTETIQVSYTASHHPAGVNLENYIVAYNPDTGAILTDNNELGIHPQYDIYFNGGSSCPAPVVGDYLSFAYTLPGGSGQAFYDIVLLDPSTQFPVLLAGDYTDANNPGWFRNIGGHAYRLQLNNREGIHNRTDRSAGSTPWFEAALMNDINAHLGGLSFGTSLEDRLSVAMIVKLHGSDHSVRCTPDFGGPFRQYASLAEPSFNGGDPLGDRPRVYR